MLSVDQLSTCSAAGPSRETFRPRIAARGRSSLEFGAGSGCRRLRWCRHANRGRAWRRSRPAPDGGPPRFGRSPSLATPQRVTAVVPVSHWELQIAAVVARVSSQATTTPPSDLTASASPPATTAELSLTWTLVDQLVPVRWRTRTCPAVVRPSSQATRTLPLEAIPIRGERSTPVDTESSSTRLLPDQLVPVGPSVRSRCRRRLTGCPARPRRRSRRNPSRGQATPLSLTCVRGDLVVGGPGRTAGGETSAVEVELARAAVDPDRDGHAAGCHRYSRLILNRTSVALETLMLALQVVPVRLVK